MRFVVFYFLLTIPFSTFAQDEDNEYNENIVSYLGSKYYEFGGHYGKLLPVGVSGVDESYPVYGGWFSHPTGYGNLEYSFNLTQSQGVSWQDGSLGLRIDFSIFDFFEGYFRLGIHTIRHKGADTTSETFNYENSYGSHIGFGNYIQLAGPYWGNVDFKFGFTPGSTLIVSAGLAYRWGSDEEKTEN